MSAVLAEVEYPTLDLELDELSPPKRAVWLRGVEHADLPALLASRLPGVVHSRRRLDWGDEHQFICTGTGEAVRYCLTMGSNKRVVATVEETPGSALWDRIVVACDQWERAGRTLGGAS